MLRNKKMLDMVNLFPGRIIYGEFAKKSVFHLHTMGENE
jgi:hypothetical protein